MKPILIKFAAFGPYLEEQTIDFTSLNDAGLFLISGETGSGKTVILDAITYALYGKSSGGNRGDFTSMRCLSAPDSVNTEVEFVFEIHGRVYKFTRTLKYGRKNLNVSQNVLMKNGSGIFEPLFENPRQSDLESTAQSLLGLTYEQFRQVIILPQGQFERLLTSNSKDKEKILTSLFGTEKWGKAAQLLYERISAQMKELTEEKSAAASMLDEYGCDSLDDMNRLLSENKEKLAEIKNRLAESKKDLKKLKTNSEKQNILYEKFMSLKKYEDEYARLTERDAETEQKSAWIKASDNAEKLKPLYDALTTAKSEKSERTKALQASSQKAAAGTKEFEKAKTETDEHEKGKSGYEADLKRISALTGMIDAYKAADTLAKESNAAEKCVKLAEKDCNAVQRRLERIFEDKKQAETQKMQLYTEYSALLAKYTAGLCASLAAQLTDGSPCPVCGSISHPAPAITSDEHITEQTLDNMNERIKLCSAELERITKMHSETAAELEEKRAKLTSLKIAASEKLAEYNTAKKSFDGTIKTEAELKSAIQALEARTKKYEDIAKQLDARKKQLETEAAVLKNTEKINAEELEKAEQQFTSANREFTNALEKSDFSDEHEFIASMLTEENKNKFLSEVTQHKIDKESVAKNISELKSALKRQKKPDIAAIRAALAAAENRNSRLISDAALAENGYKELSGVYVKLEKLISSLNSRLSKTEENMLFAKRLRGDNGIGLQRYVLGIMLTTVTNEANRLLENVHSGRYRLYRSSESGTHSRLKGLEFYVHDNMCAKNRSAATLSGGEKFLVAMSLSIGLSAAVRAQSGGTQMQAMFIDEGFGTLDSSSLSDALTILSAMNHFNAVVGIISHVEALKENISTGIEITKTSNGSTLKLKD